MVIRFINKDGSSYTFLTISSLSDSLKLPENLYEVFKNIKAKSNIKPSKDKRIKLNEYHIKKIYEYADKIIKLHNYKYK